jgi:hypothetical protein
VVEELPSKCEALSFNPTYCQKKKKKKWVGVKYVLDSRINIIVNIVLVELSGIQEE